MLIAERSHPGSDLPRERLAVIHPRPRTPMADTMTSNHDGGHAADEILRASGLAWDKRPGPQPGLAQFQHCREDGSLVQVLVRESDNACLAVLAWDVARDVIYRWPEALARSRTGADEPSETGLEVWADMVEKAVAIASGQPYDHRICIELEVDKPTLFEWMTLAHERDITLNHLLNDALRGFADQFKQAGQAAEETAD